METATPNLARFFSIYVRNVQNKCGGRVLPVEYMEKLAEAVHSRGLKLHVDGARCMNACATLGVDPSVLFRGCDSISLCLSKALGAPMGSVLIGTRVRNFMTESVHLTRDGMKYGNLFYGAY